MSSNNNNGEKKHWYSMSIGAKRKIGEIGTILNGLFSYLIYNLQPALTYWVTNAELDEVLRIYLLGAIPVLLIAIVTVLGIVFKRTGQETIPTIQQQIGTPTSQVIVQAPSLPTIPTAPTTPEIPSTEV